MFKLLGKLCCWWGWHRWGQPWSVVPSEHEELHEFAVFVRCERCGTCWRCI